MKKPTAFTLLLRALAALLPLPLCAQLPLDRDGDGHSDLWQIHHGIPSANGESDSDGDGVSDADEERAGTNPWSLDSFFSVSDFQLLRDPRGTESARFTWPALSGKRYQFQQSGDLTAGSWAEFGPPVLPAQSGPATTEFGLPPGGLRGFFRAQVSDVDADGDGLTAWEESLIGTSDLTPNSGGTGGLPDTVAAAEWAETNDPGKYAGAPQANLREVDAAFIRAASGAAGGSGADIVTAAGTGGWHQLTSWRATGGANPAPLATTPPLPGHHALVHNLAPARSGAPQFFLTGRVAQDTLWLSTRSLTAGGAFVHHKTLGWGVPLGFIVEEFDVAHRTFSTRESGVTHYHVLAAAVTRATGQAERKVQVITWRVNAATGALTGLEASGPLVSGQLGAPARLKIAHTGANQFQLTYLSDLGNQVHHPVWTSDDGAVSDGTGKVTFLDIRGFNSSTRSQDDVTIAGLTASGYISAAQQPDGSMELNVWDRRPDHYLPGVYQSHLLTDDSQDSLPNHPGLGLPVPQLADSFDNLEQSGELVAQAVVAGDFNGDGMDDAAIGAPGRTFSNMTGAGGVYILQGSFSGIPNQEYFQLWTLDTDSVAGTAAAGDGFGSALAAGDFNGDGQDDLAVGIPQKTVSGAAGAGAVQIFYGTAVGLSASGNQHFTRSSLSFTAQAGDNFGAALTAGDFNGDGRDDLAIGTPGAAVGGQDGAGSVHVMWGSVTGLSLTGSDHYHQDSPGLADAAEAGDAFGSALSAGDFNGDGEDDLGIGVPLEDVSGVSNAGAVQVLYGNAGGFTASNFITRDGFSGGEDIAGSTGASDQFGSSLATGDFDNDSADDLAIGAYGDTWAGAQSGAVHVLYGTFLGLTWVNNQMFRQTGSLGPDSTLPGGGAAFADLGWSLAAGDCNADGYADLIASAPGQDVANLTDAGMFYVIRGSADGLTPGTALRVDPSRAQEESGVNQGVAGGPLANDKFAFSLACGDFDNNGAADILCGIPRTDLDNNTIQNGSAHFFRGSAEFTLTFADDFQWVPKVRHPVRGMVSDLTRENFSGTGTGKLYSHNEFLPAVQMASSTKIMTLLLAVEAIERGDVGLNDPVTASALAGSTGGSELDATDNVGNTLLDQNGNVIPFIQTGDTMPLRLLLAGMMGESCNRCSVAIGEYIALRVRGNALDFIIMMNQRAAELGMNTSVFGHPAGGWHTSLQDAITLQREGVKHPLFVQFSSFETYGDSPAEVLAGTNLNNQPKVAWPFDQFMTMDLYPGRFTWKGGNVGLWLSDTQANSVPARPSGPWCTASRVCTARRMDRTLAVCLQQTGDGDGDVQDLLDYGYRELFTPDARAAREFPQTGGIIGPEGPIRVRHFAVTAWEGHALTAVIDDHEELRLNVWACNFAANQMTPAGAASRTYQLQSGAGHAAPARTGLAEIPTTDAIADWFTANLTGEHLELKMWRCGQDE
jgi:hypothetical protein